MTDENDMKQKKSLKILTFELQEPADFGHFTC